MLNTDLAQIVTWSNGKSSIYNPEDPDWMLKMIDVFPVAGNLKTVRCPNRRVEIVKKGFRGLNKIEVFYVYDKEALERMIENNVPIASLERVDAYELSAPLFLGKDEGTVFGIRYVRF